MWFWNLAADLFVSGLGILIVCALAIALLRRINFLVTKNARQKERLERERVLQVEKAMQAEWRQKLKNREASKSGQNSKSKDWAKFSSN